MGQTGQYLIDNGLSDNHKLRKTASMDDNFSMLLAGRVDLLASPKLTLYHLIKKRGYQPENILKKQYCLEVDNLYMAFSVDTPDVLVNKFKEALHEFKQEQQYQVILQKYFH